MWCKIVLVLFVFGLTVFALEDDASIASVEDFRTLDNEKWIGLDSRPQGAVDWIPADGPIPTASQPIEEPIVKRRRVRKRKRRPQNFEREEEDELYPERTPPRPRLRRPNRPHELEEQDQWEDKFNNERRISNRPHELDQESEQWREEMMAEEPFRPIRPYKRRRLYPKYDEIPQDNESIDEEVIISSSQFHIDDDDHEDLKTLPEKEENQTPNPERNRDPFAALRDDNNKKGNIPKLKQKEVADNVDHVEQETTDKPITTRTPIDLKAILKQAGGISLSELLQQKNLTLQDLISGKEHAIAALTKIEEQQKPEPPTEVVVHKETETTSVPPPEEKKPIRFNTFRRVPVLNRKNNNQERTSNDFTAKEDDMDKRVTSPFVRKETKYFSDFKITTTTESTTERRIFVPSHPKYYTSINFKPNMKEIDSPKPTAGQKVSAIPEVLNDEENSLETTTHLPTRFTTETLKNLRRKATLPPTLFKLRNMYNSRTTPKPVEVSTENYPAPFVPEKAIKININELFGITNLFNQQKTTEGPLRIPVGIIETDYDQESTERSTTEENYSTTIEQSSESLPEKTKSTSAKEEIQEILSDTMSRENLMNILSKRNMTLKELLEQRERGSSQRHLSDIFHNQTREPEPKEHLTVDVVNRNPFGKSFEDNQVSVNKYRNIPRLEDSFTQEPDISRESRQNFFSPKVAEDYNILNNPLFRTDEKKTNEVINKLIPVWRQAYTNIHKNQKSEITPIVNNDIILSDEASRIEEIENQLAEAVNGALNEETISAKIDEESYFNLPYGVRSAIIASATIVGISLFVFVTIFIIFKLSQKKNNHLSYSNSLSSLKMRSPILETPYQKRIFGSLMDSTLGRRKKISTISTSEPQSLQDYLWENDRKPFQ